MLSLITRSTALSIFGAAVIAQLAGAVALLAPRTDPFLIPTIKQVTEISQDMTTALNGVSSRGSSIVWNLADNVTTIDDLLKTQFKRLAQSAPFPDKDAVPVVTLLEYKFMSIHLETLKLLIDKHDIIAATPALAAPLKATLTTHERIVKEFGKLLTAILPTRKDQVTRDFRALDARITDARKAYSK